MMVVVVVLKKKSGEIHTKMVHSILSLGTGPGDPVLGSKKADNRLITKK
jgi:hypothetical protein